LNKVKKLVADAGFDLTDVKHSDIISFLPILVRSNTFCYYDCKLADRVPLSCERILSWDKIAENTIEVYGRDPEHHERI